MASKCIGILMVIMIEFYIFIVVKIQANNLAPTSFPHSVSIIFPHFSELDKAHEPTDQEPIKSNIA